MLYTVSVFIYASVPRRAGARNAFYRQGGEGMRIHGNCQRLTAVLLSLTLLCGIAALPATAASVGEVVRAGIPENAVPGDIRITTYAVPNEAQMASLREDAAGQAPAGFVFYGWGS